MLLSRWMILQQINKCFNRSVFLKHSTFVKKKTVSVYSLVIFFLFYYVLKPKNEDQLSFTLPHVVLNLYGCWILRFYTVVFYIVVVKTILWYLFLFLIELPLYGKKQWEHSFKFLLLCCTSIIQLGNNMKVK